MKRRWAVAKQTVLFRHDHWLNPMFQSEITRIKQRKEKISSRKQTTTKTSFTAGRFPKNGLLKVKKQKNKSGIFTEPLCYHGYSWLDWSSSENQMCHSVIPRHFWKRLTSSYRMSRMGTCLTGDLMNSCSSVRPLSSSRRRIRCSLFRKNIERCCIVHYRTLARFHPENCATGHFPLFQHYDCYPGRNLSHLLLTHHMPDSLFC